MTALHLNVFGCLKTESIAIHRIRARHTFSRHHPRSV
jgi:hypothetical protein